MMKHVFRSLKSSLKKDKERVHWQKDFILSRHGFANHQMTERLAVRTFILDVLRYCDLLFDACYATEPSCTSHLELHSLPT